MGLQYPGSFPHPQELKSNDDRLAAKKKKGFGRSKESFTVVNVMDKWEKHREYGLETPIREN